MRHLAWAVTWMTVGLVTTLAIANVMAHNAQLNRPDPAPIVEPAAPEPAPVDRPMAKAKPSVELSRSVIVASRRHHETTN